MKHKAGLGILVFLIVLACIIYRCICGVRCTPTIRLGLNASSGFEYFILAKKAKFFKRAGLRVQLIEFGSFSDVQQAFEWGQIHGMICNLIDVMMIQQRNKVLAPKIILIPSYATPEAACHVLVDKSIKNMIDIRSKHIGGEINSFGGFVLLKALKSVALSMCDVKIHSVDPTAFETFIQKQKVQGVIAYPPYSVHLMKNFTDYHSIYSTAHWPKEMKLNVLVMNQNVLQKHAKGFQKFIANWDNLLDLYKSNPELGNTYLSHHLSVSKNRSEKIFNAVVPLKLGEQVQLFTFNKYLTGVIETINAEFLANNNLSVKDINFDEVFDKTFLYEALQHKQ
ncbi:MAG: ABC transporter substrate-binding protein [Puniceicoccales bacterium]|nr:ABC transporter substrate-binding protein [Puniceicoccales bacterium]